ncbi:MAG: DHA2 family efflux MFS transporter permease subunit [Bacteroidota bacterium]|nr:DHA2 family efflux MFS transporter permease subunit [Bacteroidota bacterium]MDP4217391.1 DHA2 family efflux MFS transporter permease subunit [Bacteroidota bacterium]MDP4245725.1 DHA2 family efflux MFS transporter permease subunit [Bacteroidota bacterium]
MAEHGFRKWIITITVIMASLLELIDTTIVNVALPKIMGNLGATLEDAGWVVTSYAVANVIILPMSGWLGDRFGRKNYFITSILVFTFASFLCGNAHSLGELVAFRILQGLAGGGLLSTAQAILMETWPREELGMATALFGLGAVVGPTVGPTIGGYITDHFDWPWIFYVNIPIGAVAAFLVSAFVRESPRYGRSKPIDWWGILLLAVGVGSLQVVLEKGESEDWFSKTYIAVLAFATVIAVILFIWRELSTDHPIVNFRILKNRSFAIGIATSFVLGFALYGSVFVFPVFCQNLLGFSAQQTGVILFPSGMATICLMPFVGMMLKRGVPGQFMATGGFFLFFVFCLMLSNSTLESGTGDFFWPLVVRGVGMAILFVPLTTLALQDLHGPDIGQGTGLNNMGRQLGGSFGIAILTTLIHTKSQVVRTALLPNFSDYNPAFVQRKAAMIQNFEAQGRSAFDAAQMANRAFEGLLTKQTLLVTYDNLYLTIGVFVLFCIPIVFLQKFKRNVALPADAH